MARKLHPADPVTEEEEAQKVEEYHDKATIVEGDVAQAALHLLMHLRRYENDNGEFATNGGIGLAAMTLDLALRAYIPEDYNRVMA